MTPDELKGRMGEVQVVDVREPYEWDAGRIEGSVHIEFAELPARAGELDKDRPVVFYCRVGSRSTVALEAFAGAGFDADHLDGGIVGWDEAGLPVEGEIAPH